MTLTEIMAAVERGHTVHWGNPGYTVIKNAASHQFYIHCSATGSSSPLIHKGQLAGNECDFFLAPESRQPGEAEGDGSSPARFTHYFDVRCENHFDSDIEDFYEAFDAWAKSFSDRQAFRRELLSCDEGTKSLAQGVIWSDTIDHQDAQFAGEGE